MEHAGDHRNRFGVAAAAATIAFTATAAVMLVATVVSMWVLSAMAVTVRHGRSRMARWAQQQHYDLQQLSAANGTSASVTVAAVTVTTAAVDSRLHDPGGGTARPLPPSLATDDVGQQQQHYRHKANSLLRIVESQQQLGGNCTAGTDLNMGDGVVDRYAQVPKRKLYVCIPHPSTIYLIANNNISLVSRITTINRYTIDTSSSSQVTNPVTLLHRRSA